MGLGYSRTKCWRGFGIMCVGVVAWVIGMRLAASSFKMPQFRSGATAAEIAKQAEQIPSPTSMMWWMAVAQGVAGVIVLGGMIVTGMGLVEYSCELRRVE